MKRTLLTSLLCVAMAVTLTAGCGSKAESKDSKKPEKKEQRRDNGGCRICHCFAGRGIFERF